MPKPSATMAVNAALFRERGRLRVTVLICGSPKSKVIQAFDARSRRKVPWIAWQLRIESPSDCVTRLANQIISTIPSAESRLLSRFPYITVLCAWLNHYCETAVAGVGRVLMKDPIRVLVIEDRKSDRFMAQQLLLNYELDFTWQHVASESELRSVARGFDPSLVFSADELTLNSRSAALDMLRLLSLQSVVIHVAEVDGHGSRATSVDDAALDWKPAHLARLPAATLAVPHADAAAAAGPPAHWRRSLPSLLETSADLVAISDSAGWITYANTHTSRLCGELRRPFGEPGESSIGTVLGLAYDFSVPGPGPHRLALFDALTGLPSPVHLSDLVGGLMARPRANRAALPIVALDLQGLRVMNELCGPAMSDEVLNVVGSGLKSGAAGCGMIARVGEDDILVVLPHPLPAADAAVNVQVNRRAIPALEDAAGREASVIASANCGAALPPPPITAAGRGGSGRHPQTARPRRALSAAVRAAERARLRRRGARSLESCERRECLAGDFHSGRRAHRNDRYFGRERARQRLRNGCGMAWS
jgi:GGDEF domain-containing protein